MPKNGIAIIGAGMIGAAHAHGYRTYLPRFTEGIEGLSLTTICDENQSLARTTASTYGFDKVESDWKAVLSDPDIGIVSIALPNFLHLDVVLAALEHGKHVICEKPLALNAADALTLYRKSQTAGRCAATVFNYRRYPAVAEARALIASGAIGKPQHLLLQYQCDYAADPNLPHSWRYTRSRAGGGALLDIGAHAIDTARFLIGDVDTVAGALASTTIKERFVAKAATIGHNRVQLSAETRVVDNDDIVSALLSFENGCQGMFSASRVAVGNGNALSFTVSGATGTISFSTTSPGKYDIAQFDGSGQSPFRSVNNRGASPYVSQLLPVPHDGVAVGYAEAFGFMIYDFLSSIAAKEPMRNGSFLDGLRVAEILDAIELAAAQGGAVNIHRAI